MRKEVCPATGPQWLEVWRRGVGRWVGGGCWLECVRGGRSRGWLLAIREDLLFWRAFFARFRSILAGATSVAVRSARRITVFEGACRRWSRGTAAI